MAYGTETIPKVDKIVGPGGGPVNEAKLIVSRDVAIDLPAGPSEVVVAADLDVEESLIEQELAAQLEHGPDSRAFVVRVRDDLDAAVDEINGYAESLAPNIRNAGAVFVGKYSPVPAGDYATGGNHVLPTGGWSRSVGGLGLESFMKTVTVQRLTQAGLELLAPTIEALAEIEGLPNHKATARR
jgi:histidinol dehydrogenase